MPEIINSITNDKNYSKSNFNRKFLILESISDLKKLKPEIELCIIYTDFNKDDLKLAKKAKGANKKTEFWLCSDYLSKENILNANKIGIKTVISSPVDYKLVEVFFNKQDTDFYINQISEDKYNSSCIANSKVMVVDDNLMNVELLKEILSKFNLEITSFLKPKEACKAMLHEKFDLFLLDVMMPEMSGFELAKRINENPLNKDVPILFISALSDAHNKIKGYNLGSVSYIEKPFDVNIVKSQIFNILKNKKAQEIISENKETFWATVAHDLKTPISAGINALNLLLNENLGKLEETQHEMLEDILNSTKFMQDMVENILCKNKLDASKVQLYKQVYSIKEIVEHCIELTKYILIPRKQRIQFECNIENPLLPLDFTEIKRAIHNLIANASEYSPDGEKIFVRIFDTGKNIGILVQDFGKGIALEHQKDVFSQYMSMAKKYKTVGSGLGLYITKNIIEAHNGEITLESKIGEGTKITILLPKYIKD